MKNNKSIEFQIVNRIIKEFSKFIVSVKCQLRTIKITKIIYT